MRSMQNHMTRHVRSRWSVSVLFAACSALAGCVAADNTAGSDGLCPYPDQYVKVPTGKLHGEPCSADADCKWGICSKTSLQAGGTGAGICTKQCNCGLGSQCSDDNTSSAQFTCIFASSGGKKECARSCKTDAECASWNPALPHCSSSGGGGFQTGLSVCSAKP